MTGVNTIEWDSTGVPWRPTAPRHFLDQAVARLLEHDEPDTADCD